LDNIWNNRRRNQSSRQKEPEMKYKKRTFEFHVPPWIQIGIYALKLKRGCNLSESFKQ
jgi:hypothetical protein